MIKIQYFIKGVRAMLDIVLVLTVLTLVERNVYLEKELKTTNTVSSNSQACYTKKHPKNTFVSEEKANYPIGFA